MTTDPKCWLCGVFMQPPTTIQYQPLICISCLPGYKERKFVFSRPTQEEMEELVKAEWKPENRMKVPSPESRR